MFLSKKNTNNAAKNKGKNTNQKALGGWGDEDKFKQVETTIINQRKISEEKNESNMDLLDNDIVPEKKISYQPSIIQYKEVMNTSNDNPHKKQYYNWDELNEMTGIQCERRIVEDIVEPGGVRIKPNDKVLEDFLKEAKVLDIVIVGSLLLSKIEVNYPFVIKAKSLYTIEHLIKKNTQFMNYFKKQKQKIVEFPEPQENVNSYQKILKNVMNVFGLETESQKDENTFAFVDPGYNQNKQSDLGNFLKKNQTKSKKVGPKKLISPNEAKKLVGKNEQKIDSTQKADLLDIEEVISSKNQEVQQIDLLGQSQNEKKLSKQISFDQLLEKKQTKKDEFDLIL